MSTVIPIDDENFYLNNNNNNNNNNNDNLFIYSALFNILGDQKRITTINKLKTVQILEIYKYIWYLRDIKS